MINYIKAIFRPYYSVFRPISVPLVQLHRRPYGYWSNRPISLKTIPEVLFPFDAVLMRGKASSRLSRFYPRYPFALERGPRAKELFNSDPNNPFGHEPELAHLLDLLVPDDGIFLDVGSNYGYFSIYLATRPGFHGHIHAFEPVASTFAGLSSLVDSLKCSETVTCHQTAASNELGTAKMVVAGIDPGLASIKDGMLGEGEIIQKIALDSLNLKRVDFIKVDVEGHEEQALKGAQTIIESKKPFIFLESWSSAAEPEKVLEPLKFLLDRGYKLYLPAWAQSSGLFHVGIGASHETHTFAMVPFELQDRFVFPGGPSQPINIFACPVTRVEELGDFWNISTVLDNRVSQLRKSD